MRQIPISKKVSGSNRHPETIVMETIAYATVDDKHYAELNQYIWTLHRYVRRNERGKTILMHTDIWCRLEGHPNTPLDHKDRNPLNNQLCNLRPAAQPQNQANQGLSVNSTIGFKGVYWHKGANKHQAQIGVNGQKLYLGLFSTPVEAAKAYDEAATKHFGEFAATNQSLGLV